MNKLRSLVVAGSLLAAAVGGSAVLAQSASADEVDCIVYLNDINVTVGDGAYNACHVGQNGGAINFAKCVVDLESLNVSSSHSVLACEAAEE